MEKTLAHIITSRRWFLLGAGAAGFAITTAVEARADAAVSALSLGVVANTSKDQSAALQAAIDTATAKGLPLFLPAGTYAAEKLRLSSGASLLGMPGNTIVQGSGTAPVVIAENAENVSLTGLTIKGRASGPDSVNLVRLQNVTNFDCRQMTLADCGGNGVRLDACGGRIVDSTFSGFGRSAIHAQDSVGLVLSGNVISQCANGGIRVWRSAQGADGTIVTQNRISAIGSQSGNGQNGNGINVFRANEVIVSDNQISDCDFSAIRLNGTDDTIVRGNMCTQLREVAIFSEFSFSGSIIASNIVDEAAMGISMTNFDQGGRLAVCTGNMVRNIWPSSPTNPDTNPAGIMAQADAAVTGNVVENVPGAGIAAGWGPFLRNVLISNNSVINTKVGIAVSVAKGAGKVHVSGNQISGSEYRNIGGFAWTEPKGEELMQKPNQFDNVTVSENSLG